MPAKIPIINVRFNNEIWRIVGLVNVKTDNGVSQRIKIVRTNGIEIDGQLNFENYKFDFDENYNYSNNWTHCTLKDMLNDIYYYGIIRLGMT